jgi:hypothetical protein
MSAINDYTFRTKTGFCTITAEQIILTRQGVRGASAEQVVGSSIGRSLLLYSLFGGAALLLGLWLIYQGSAFTGAFLALVGSILLWNVFASRNNSAANRIDRAAIRGIEAHPPRPPLTRGYFNVYFLEDGQEHKRIIMLPSSLMNGQEEYQQAETIMRDTGLLTPR